MKNKIKHKANYKKTVVYYLGFGAYGEVTTPFCRKKIKTYCPSFVAGYAMTRNWKDVDCKKCLKNKPN
jgi:hypothetical protein